MRQRIERGIWAYGDRISTLEELEQEFSVARVTVRQAIELLRVEGLLDAQQGRGTFVSGRPNQNRWLNLAVDFDTMLASLKDNVVKNVHIDENLSMPELREGEGRLAEGYILLRSVQHNGNRPFSVVNLHLAEQVFRRDRKAFMQSAALPRIVEMADVTLAHAYQTLVIGVADPETARLLEIGLGEPTADCRLVLVDSTGVAIYVADIHYQKNCFAQRTDLLGKARAGHRRRKS